MCLREQMSVQLENMCKLYKKTKNLTLADTSVQVANTQTAANAALSQRDWTKKSVEVTAAKQ